MTLIRFSSWCAPFSFVFRALYDNVQDGLFSAVVTGFVVVAVAQGPDVLLVVVFGRKSSRSGLTQMRDAMPRKKH